MSLYIHDNLLGHVPNPGAQLRVGNLLQTIDSAGLRYSGEAPPSGEKAILAVGDSFAYGEEVNDDEAWPACLQRLTGRRVMNGGVTGYGFDQTVLRAEDLAGKLAPAAIIVSFIENDLLRAEMSTLWWRDKPWFAIENDRLVYKPAGTPHAGKPSRWLHSLLGRGIARLPLQWKMRAQYAENVLTSALPTLLQQRLGYWVRVHPAGAGLDIALRLVERLAALQRDRGVKVVLMPQYPPIVWTNPAESRRQRHAIQAVLDRAAVHGLATLDTYPRLAAEPSPQRLYGTTHMNARGNSMIASLLAATLPTLLA